MDSVVPQDLRKHLLEPKRHLVYFFERQSLSFAVVTQEQIKEWVEGRAQFYAGRLDTQSHSKHTFMHAFQAARVQVRNMKPERSRSAHEEPRVVPTPVRTGTRSSSKRSLALSDQSAPQSQVKRESPRKRAKQVAGPPRREQKATTQVAYSQIRLRNSKKKSSQEPTPRHELMMNVPKTPPTPPTPAPSSAPFVTREPHIPTTVETKTTTTTSPATSVPEDIPTMWSSPYEPAIWCLVAVLFFFLPKRLWPLGYTMLILASAHFIFRKVRQSQAEESVE